MKTLALKSGLDFGVIPESASRLRLAIIKDGEEQVCRKESKKKLLEFLKGSDGSIFKGRLILHKKGSEIEVAVKKEVIDNLKPSALLKII